MIIGFDYETDPFAPRNLAPEPVCMSFTDDAGDGFVVASCESEFDDLLEHIWKQDMIVGANTAFEACVTLARRPKLAHLVWKAYDEERVADILIREHLKVLGTTGDLKFAVLPNGAKINLQFSQGALEKKYLGIDRTDEKDDDEGWRVNYSALRGMPASDYPADAFNYSRDDSVNARKIYLIQEKDRDLLKAQHLNARAALALYLNSCWGFPIDQTMVEKMFAEISARFDDKNFQRLVSFGILRPAQPPRPHSRQEQKAIAAIGRTAAPVDWTPHIERLTAMGFNFTARKEASINETLLRTLTEKICIEHGVEVRKTNTDGLVAFGEEVQADLKGLDPTFDEFIDRNEIKKLVTTTLPMMRQGRNHPKYRVLVKTSRTSSYGNSKKDKNPAYPSGNIQQIDPRVREAYVADPGHVLCSIDYNFIELVSAAQKCLDLFGHSVLADKINAGFDPHAYLGAGLARKLDPAFKASANSDENYHSFVARRKEDPKWGDHWRGLAKPTGLGFPGGLGARTFVAYAKSTYGVDLIKIAGSMDAAIELAKTLKAEWLDLYPEFQDYFNWVNRECVDVEWSIGPERRYCYVSPHGTVRRNCFYTECTNGAALQTATAEGAKIALYMLAKAMHDSSVGSSLLGCHQVAFIHDEVILQLPLDDFMHERAFEAAALFREGMSQVMTKVKVGAEPALMMRWNKAAKTVYDKNNRLIPWFPSPKSSSQPPASSATPSTTA